MSTPWLRHTLQRELERGRGGSYVAARYAQMRCDGATGLCRIPPERAPALVVPAKSGLVLPGWEARQRVKALTGMHLIPPPLVQYTTLHYCRAHQPELTVAELLDDKVKQRLETVAKTKWSHEFTPDFDAAFVKWVLVTAPEYGEYLIAIERGLRRIAGVPLL